MKTLRRIRSCILLLPLLLAGARAQQSMPGNAPATPHQQQQKPAQSGDMPGMQMGKPGENSAADFLPQIGEQTGPGGGPVYQLAGLEEKALKGNPTLSESDNGVDTAKAHRRQVGLWPNPTMGYIGDEIAGGLGVNGGRQGGFVEQTIILGRKLYLAQQVAGADVKIADLAREEQRYRVQNAIRAAYFQTLAGQEMVALAEQYVKLTAATLETAQRLHNIGARDESEVAMAEIEMERAKLAADVQRAHLQQEWENLRSVVGDPALPVGQLAGKLDADLPQLDSRQLVDALVANSPAMKMAQASATRAEASVEETRRQAVPDLRVRAGLEQNLETNDLTGKPYGLEGFAEVRVELPIFNRNQGNVAAARTELERSRAETRRVELQLRQQAAMAVEQYEAARMTVESYQKQIIPRQQRLYEMQRNAWGRMALSYPQVLSAQQGLFTAQAEYIHALESLRTSAVALSGFLLTDGLMAPGAGPGER
ncbi:MAG: TolC family protein [Candidatus Korobacteraceae bacterium]